MEKRQLLYKGKAKSLYATDDSDRVWVEFRNDTSAFDGEKVEALPRKGMTNNYINAHVMGLLEKAGIHTHFEKIIGPQESLCKKLDMIPIECVVRNVAAGSICRRLGVDEGTPLDPPTFELFLKNDALHDPMINEYHVRSFGWASESDIARMKELTFRVNAILKPAFEAAGMSLVDYKLEFGRFEGEVVLGDEFTPDGCRLWDKASNEKLDKDRFRRNLGNVVESYEEVAKRLGVVLPE